MIELKKGMFARSLAGHDKGTWYMILGSDDRCVILTDGRLRKVEHPKRKNRCHIQPDCHIPEEIRKLLEDDQELRDEDIRKAIKSKEEKGCQRQM